MIDLAIVNCKLVSPKGVIKACVAIDNGKIVALADSQLITDNINSNDNDKLISNIIQWISYPFIRDVATSKIQSKAIKYLGENISIEANITNQGNDVETVDVFIILNNEIKSTKSLCFR